VLAHYEAQVITPFSVMGITVTKQMLTLIFGFFGAAIAGVRRASAQAAAGVARVRKRERERDAKNSLLTPRT